MADGVLPPVADFIRDWHSSLKVGRVYEVQSFYERGVRDVSKRFFADKPWPAEGAVMDLVKGDRVFLTLYRLIYFRHLLALSVRAGVERAVHQRQLVEAWSAYRSFFALAGDKEAVSGLELPLTWVWDILGVDMPYHLFLFHELRAGGSPTSAVAHDEAADDDDGSGRVGGAGLGGLRAAPAGGEGEAGEEEAAGSSGLEDGELSKHWH